MPTIHFQKEGMKDKFYQEFSEYYSNLTVKHNLINSYLDFALYFAHKNKTKVEFTY
jgi:hypothetical protein